MKKVTYLMTLVLAITIVSYSCSKKDDDDPIVKTLQEQYPDWSNLTWVSTGGISTPDMYPKLEISIVDNEGTIKHYYDSETLYQNTFSEIKIEDNEIAFKCSIGTTVGVFSKDGDKITLITNGLIKTGYIYVLQIN